MQTLAEFLDALKRLRLLEPGELEQVTRQLAGQKNVDPRQVAKKLVQKGALTHFQVNQLFKGKGNELLLGSYVLLDLVGEGGMGAVYKARNWKLGQVVAVKLIRPERLANPAAVRRFQREIHTSAQLHHPNIVRTIDADEVKGTNLLVMEYVGGGQDLHKRVRENGPLPIENVCRYSLQAALGLQHAFERGLVHRDIKPHNLLVAAPQTAPSDSGTRLGAAPTGGAGPRSAAPQAKPVALSADPGPRALVKILDFGLARLGEGDDSSTLTQEGAVMGTVDYLAPEQARDAHSADIRSDLYSLGCTIYYLLTGQAPFVGGTAAEKMYKHQFEDPPAVELQRLETPPGLADIIRKLLAKRPEDRYQTPAALAVDLEAVLSGRPVSASARPAPAAPPRPSGKNVAAPAVAPAEALQDTENPFAAIVSETAADGPVSIRMRTPAAPAKNNKKGLIIGLSVGASLLVMVPIAVLVVNSFRKPPAPPPEEPKTAAAKPTRKPSLLDLAGQETGEDKLRAEAEAAEKKRKEEEAAAEKKRLAGLELVWKKWTAAEEPLRAKRHQEAETSFKDLEARLQEKDAAFAPLAKEVAAFQSKHGGTPSALRAAELLSKLRSPLDGFDVAKLPADAMSLWQAWGRTGAPGFSADGPPKELVAVRGEHRGRLWGTISQVAFAGTQDKAVVALCGSVLFLATADTREILAVVPQADVWALTPDGKLLVTGTFDGGLRLFDVDAGKELWSFDAFAGGGVRSVAFSPDGQVVATGGGLNRAGTSNAGYLVRLWDVATGRPRGNSTALDNQVIVLKYSADGNVLAASTSSGSVSLLQARKPQDTTLVAQVGGPIWLTFSPDDKTLAVHGAVHPKSVIKLVDVGTKKVVVSADDLAADGSGLARSLFLSDGREFACGEADGTVRVWEIPKEIKETKEPKVASDEPKRKWEAHKEGGVSSIGLSPDGKELWTASGWNSGDVKIWDAKTGKAIKSMQGYDEAVRAISELRMTPDGKIVGWLCAGKDVRLWQRDKQTLLSTVHRLDAGPYAFSADGRRVLTGDANTIRVWDTATGLEQQPVRGRAAPLVHLVFAPDSRLLLAADARGTIHRWNLGASREGDIAQWQYPPGAFTYPPRPAFLADGQRFATFGEATHFYRWNLAAEAGVLIVGNSNGTNVSPSGRFGLTSVPDGEITVWDMESIKQMGVLKSKAPEDPRVVDVAVTPDDRLAVVLQGSAYPRLLKVFALDTGDEVYRFKSHNANRVAVSPDGRHVVTTDLEGVASVFDLHTGAFVRKIEIGQPLADLPVQFSPDGKLAAALYGNALALLEMPSGTKRQEWHFPGTVHGVAFAPDSRHLVAGNSNGTIYMLRLAQ